MKLALKASSPACRRPFLDTSGCLSVSKRPIIERSYKVLRRRAVVVLDHSHLQQREGPLLVNQLHDDSVTIVHRPRFHCLVP